MFGKLVASRVALPPPPLNLHVCACGRRAGLRAQRLENFQSLSAEKGLSGNFLYRMARITEARNHSIAIGGLCSW